MKTGGFHSHHQALGRQLGPSGLAARWREADPSPDPRAPDPGVTKEVAKVDPAIAIEEEAVAPDKGGKNQSPPGLARKAEGPKVHIGFQLAADVVESVRASGPGYNVRVEEALRAAGFGVKAKKRRAEKR